MPTILTTRPSTAPEAAPDVEPEVDRRVDEAGMDSFPASDPPAWWAGTNARTVSS